MAAVMVVSCNGKHHGDATVQRGVWKRLNATQVVDVFAMPQSGTGVSVEAVDPVFQTKMLDMLKQTGRCGGSREQRPAAQLDSSIPARRVRGWITPVQGACGRSKPF